MSSDLPCDLYILPELANSGYRFKDKEEARTCAESISDSKFIKQLKKWAVGHNCYIVTGLCEKEHDKLYNSSVLIGPQGVEGIYRKLHLFMDEKGIFEPGNLGLPVFDTVLGKIGMLVCFDWMFPEAWRAMALSGCQLIAHPSNLILPYCQRVVTSYALVNKCFIATTNRVGEERGLQFTGHSVLASPNGDLLIDGSENNEGLYVAEIDIEQANDKHITSRNHVFNDRRIDVYGSLNS